MVSRSSCRVSGAADISRRTRIAQDRDRQNGPPRGASVILVTPEPQDMTSIETHRGLSTPNRPRRVFGPRLSRWQIDHPVRNHCAFRAQGRTVYLPFTFGDSQRWASAEEPSSNAER